VNVTLLVDALGPRLSGIGRYTWELAARLPQQPGIDQLNYYIHGHFIDDPSALVRGTFPRPRKLFPRALARRLARRRLGRSLVHGPNFFLPPEVDSGIVTVHDLSVFRYPETHPAERLHAFEREFAGSLDRAWHLITDTETVKRELVADFSVPETGISVVPLGVDERYRPHSQSELREALEQWQLTPGGYSLCVSTLEPRKKIAELLRAWRELPASVVCSMPLVLAGAEGWLNQELHDEIRGGGVAGWLRHLGFVPEDDLPALYAGTALFLYPSTYEGFGLPPIEAMASGVPVLVANRSCLPEVCGDAARYIDPDDTAGFRDAIIEALADEDWRAASLRRGLSQAAKYRWEDCASKTAEIYLRFRR